MLILEIEKSRFYCHSRFSNPDNNSIAVFDYHHEKRSLIGNGFVTLLKLKWKVTKNTNKFDKT